MNRGRAETHLRQLAEAELRRATAPGALSLGPAGTLPLVAQALIAVGAVDVGTADQIQAEFDLALAARYQAAGMTPQALARLHGVRPPRAVTETVTASGQPPWRVVPAGQVIRIRDGEIRGELGLLDLRPDPPHEIGWLDLRTAPGEPATRIRLDPPDPQLPAPQVTVTRTAHRPAAGPPPRPRCPSWTASGSPSWACTKPSAAPSCTCTRAASRWRTTGSTTGQSGPCPPCGSATTPAAGTPRTTTPPRSLGGGGEITLELAIAPPLEAGTPHIELVATGPSAHVQARLPLSWKWNP